MRFYLLVNVAAFLAWLAVGAYHLINSVDGNIPGWTGGPVDQVFWYAVGSTYFTTAAFGLPVLIGALVVVAIADKLTGPRGS